MDFSGFTNSKDIWAGLNNPGMSIDDADIVIFGIPYDGAVSFRSGACDAPNTLRNITYTIDPTTEDFQCFSGLKVVDLGNVDCSSREAFFKEAEATAAACASKRKFFIMIGGDHSVTIPVHRGVNRGLNEDFGIIHIDAHFDLCNDQDGNLYSHGSTERRAIELDHVAGIDSIFFLGIRCIDMPEYEFAKNNHINVIPSKVVRKIGWEEASRRIVDKMSSHKNIYISLDIDCLDPSCSCGTGTPQFGGLDFRELINILDYLFKHLNVIGMDVVEVAPSLDPSLGSLFAARKIISEVMGYWYGKNIGFEGQYFDCFE